MEYEDTEPHFEDTPREKRSRMETLAKEMTEEMQI